MLTLREAGGMEGWRCYVEQDETVLTLTTTLVVHNVMVTLRGAGGMEVLCRVR